MYKRSVSHSGLQDMLEKAREEIPAAKSRAANIEQMASDLNRKGLSTASGLHPALKYGLPAAGIAAALGGGYLLHQHLKKKKEQEKMASYQEITERAFLDELDQITKEAGIMSFLGGGLKGISQTIRGGGAFAKGREAAGGLLGHMKQIYRAGATPMGERAILGPGGAIMAGARGGGVMGGLGALARSRYGQMAAVPLAAGGALWAGKKLLGGGQQQQPQQQYYQG